MGRNYRGSHSIFPVRFEGENYVVKKPFYFAVDKKIQQWYAFQEACFVGGRQVISASRRLEREQKKLQESAGEFMPAFIAYRPGLLIRKHIYGDTLFYFQHLRDKERFLEHAIQSLRQIHDQGLLIGDGHVKQVVREKIGHKAYWLPSGAYDESDLLQAQARETLKLIYSSFTATRDIHLALHTAKVIVELGDSRVVEKAAEMIERLNVGWKLYFSTRIPLDGHDHKLIAGCFWSR